MKYILLLPALFALNLSGAIVASPSSPAVSPGDVTVVQTQGDKELSWVDEQIKAILPARAGVSDSYINALNDPIKYASPSSNKSGNVLKLLAPPKLGTLGGAPLLVPKVVEEPLKLQALFNKTALINGKWYRLNDRVRSYSLSEIKLNSIVLNGPKDQKLILFLSKPNTNIKITTK